MGTQIPRSVPWAQSPAHGEDARCERSCNQSVRGGAGHGLPDRRRGGRQTGRPDRGADDVGGQRAAAHEPRHDDARPGPHEPPGRGRRTSRSAARPRSRSELAAPSKLARSGSGEPEQQVVAEQRLGEQQPAQADGAERAAGPGAARHARQRGVRAGEPDEAERGRQRPGPTTAGPAPRSASGGSVTARRTSSAAPTRGSVPNVIAASVADGGEQPAAARHERDEDRRAEPGAHGGQRGVGQQAGERERHEQPGRRAPRRRARSTTAARRRPRAGAARPCRRRRRPPAAPRRARRRGRSDRRARPGAGAACGRSAAHSSAGRSPRLVRSAGWTMPTRRSVAAGLPARTGLTPASPS